MEKNIMRSSTYVWPTDVNDKCCHNVGNRGYLGINLPFGIFSELGSDNDGDSIGVHGLLSEDSEVEAEMLMNPINNQRSVADGRYTSGPTHEVLAGIAYATDIGFHNDSSIVSRNINDVIRRLDLKYIKINTPIEWRGDGRRLTCAGRLILEEMSGKIIDGILDKPGVSRYLSELHEERGPELCAEFLHGMQSFGLEIITMFGPSISRADFSDEEFDPIRDRAIEDLKTKVNLTESIGDKHALVQETIDQLYRRWVKGDTKNTLRFFANYASRLSPVQIRQLVVARGVQTRVGGGAVAEPLYNTLIGQNPIQFFSGVRGARAALVAKISVTPEAGYLTRRMVSAARDIYITEKDCGTTQTMFMDEMRGHYIGGELAKEGPGRARSIITCEAKGGFCARCYGVWAQDNKLVKTGTAVGVVASQSLSERTIQQSMKMKHLGGMMEGSESVVNLYAPCSGVLGCTETCLKLGSYVYPFQRARTVLLLDYNEEVEKGQLIGYVHPVDLSTTKKVDKYLEASKSAPRTIAPVSGMMTRSARSILIDGEIVGSWDKDSTFNFWDGEVVNHGDLITDGHEDVLGMIKDGDYDLAYETLLRELRKILGTGISPQHIETMIRAVMEISLDENGIPVYRRDRPELETQLIGMTAGSSNSPRVLRSLGFGYVRSTLEESILRDPEGLPVPAEAVILGQRVGEAYCED